MKIGGVEFRRGIVQWEDAFKLSKAPIEKVLAIVKGSANCGPNLLSGPWYVELNNHLVICHEFCAETGCGDFTVVAISPAIEFRGK